MAEKEKAPLTTKKESTELNKNSAPAPTTDIAHKVTAQESAAIDNLPTGPLVSTVTHQKQEKIQARSKSKSRSRSRSPRKARTEKETSEEKKEKETIHVRHEYQEAPAPEEKKLSKEEKLRLAREQYKQRKMQQGANQ